MIARKLYVGELLRKSMQEKNVLIKTLNGFFLGLSATVIITFLFLGVLPTHDSNEHTAIKLSFIPFVNPNLGFLTQNEQSHMADVRTLVYTSVVLFLLTLWTSRNFGVHRFSGYGLLLVLAFLTGIALKGFSGFWEKFHQVLFPQGNWTFPADSMLIQLYPENYFFAASLIFAAILIIIASVFIQDAWRKRLFRKQVKKVRLL